MTNYKEFLAQSEALEKQIEETRKAELNSAIAQVRQLIAECSMTSTDCGYKSGAASASKKANSVSVAVPKFYGPNGETELAADAREYGWLHLRLKDGKVRNF